MTTEKSSVTLRLDEDQRRRWVAVASAESGRSQPNLSAWMRSVIERHVDQVVAETGDDVVARYWAGREGSSQESAGAADEETSSRMGRSWPADEDREDRAEWLGRFYAPALLGMDDDQALAPAARRSAGAGRAHQAVSTVTAARLIDVRARARPSGVAALTDRELEVATTYAYGGTYRSVGEALGMSPRTVEAHMARVYDKLSIERRDQLAVALREGSPESGPEPEPGPGAT